MHSTIQRVCELITGPQADSFLRLIQAIFLRREEKQNVTLPPDETAIRQAIDLGLVLPNGNNPQFTDQGFVVASVVKEYCRWLDFNRRMPPPRPPEAFYAGKDVLDLGCSFGRWIWEFQPVAKSVVGLEVQPEFLELGKALAQREGISAPKIILASAEDLRSHCPPNSFDFVFSRLVLNHVRIYSTLTQVAEVLRPDGILWLQIETFPRIMQRLFQREGRLRSKMFEGFAILNTLVCMATGRQISLHTRGRMFSTHKPAYPSLRWWRRTCSALGLRDFHLEHDAQGTAAFWVRKASRP
jgi:SAM-dependent methyltransferase